MVSGFPGLRANGYQFAATVEKSIIINSDVSESVGGDEFIAPVGLMVQSYNHR
jgi:hypothetical protein